VRVRVRVRVVRERLREGCLGGCAERAGGADVVVVGGGGEVVQEHFCGWVGAGGWVRFLCERVVVSE